LHLHAAEHRRTAAPGTEPSVILVITGIVGSGHRLAERHAAAANAHVLRRLASWDTPVPYTSQLRETGFEFGPRFIRPEGARSLPAASAAGWLALGLSARRAGELFVRAPGGK